MKSEHFEHGADVGVRGFGATPAEAFEGAALALFALLAEDPSRVRTPVEERFEVRAAGLEELLALGRERRSAIMCAESVWWRCHRRIITDYLLARGRDVFHLVSSDVPEPAKMTPDAVAVDAHLEYPGAQASLL